MKNGIAQYKNIWKYLKRYWYLELLALVFIVISTVASIRYNWLIRSLIDDVFIPKKLELLLPLCLLFAFLVLLTALASLFKNYFFSKVGQNVIADIRLQFFNHVLSLPVNFFSKTQSGEVVSRITSDVENVQEMVSNSIVEFFTSSITAIGILIWLFIIEWKLTLLLLVEVPIFIIISQVLGKSLNSISQKIQEQRADMTGTIQEAVSGIETLKAFCMGNIISNAFAKKVWTLAKKIVRRNIRFDFAQSLWQIVLIPYQAVFFGVGGYWYITRGVPSIGTLFAFLNYIGILIPATMTLINILMQISEDFASFDRVTEYLEQEPEKSGTKVIPESPSLEVVFQNVSFSYDNVNLIVNDISFTAESGKCVALVGQTGSGKTTLVRLLLKFYDCQKGNITISNIDIKDISLQSLRSRIGIVTQETFLFNRSIKENLLYANPLATMENIIDCCKKAQIHEFILSLALGYDTIIGERGVNLSGGEKQRLSIARVLLKNPDIVIMDESTSSLDVITEALLLKATNEYFKDKTMIIIAHRLSTIRKADKIIVLENGHISEIGEYDELVNKNGLFSKLHYQQFNDKNNIVSSQTAIVS